ncbi:MAG: twin-arginine translocation signal domain-containing protein, partial [Desulfotignum sp.]
MKPNQSPPLMSEDLKDKGISRRSFLKATAAAGAAVSLGTGVVPQMKALAAASGPTGAEPG